MTRPNTFRSLIEEHAGPHAEEVSEGVSRRVRELALLGDRPRLPILPKIETPAAVIDGESAEAARSAMATVDEHSAEFRRFLREGATYRRETGYSVPISEWDAAHDRLHDLSRLRQRLQETLGRYRRERTSFERAFVEAAVERLDPVTLAEITAKAQRATRGHA